MTITSINDDRFRKALADEMPGLAWSVYANEDMLNLRFSFRVSSQMEYFVTDEQTYDQVKILAERVRQEALVKTGASRIVQAANDQAEQYRLENSRLSQLLQDRNEEITGLKAQIGDIKSQVTYLQEQIGEEL